MTDPQTPKGQDAPERIWACTNDILPMTAGQAHISSTPDGDATEYTRADLLTAAQARAEQAEAEVAKTDALMAAGFAEYERRLEQAEAEVARLREYYEPLIDAAHLRHKDGGNELARLVIDMCAALREGGKANG
jgi:hypothetical protein